MRWVSLVDCRWVAGRSGVRSGMLIVKYD